MKKWKTIVGNKLTNPYRGNADIAPTLTAAMGMGGKYRCLPMQQYKKPKPNYL